MLTKVTWLPTGTTTFLGLTAPDAIVITTACGGFGVGLTGAPLDPEPPHAATARLVAASQRSERVRCDVNMMWLAILALRSDEVEIVPAEVAAEDAH